MNYYKVPLKPDQVELLQDFDAFVCGSDQIWNPYYNKDIQALLEANELAVGKDHQFKGRYEAEKNAVIISLEKDEREW